MTSQNAIGATSAGPLVFPSRGQAWWTTSALCLATLLSYLDRQLIYLLIDPIRHSLHVTDTQISMIQGLAFILLYTFVSLPIGRLVDRTNRRNLIIFGILSWSLATMACGFATDFWSLFSARALVGMGEAVLTPAAVSILSDCFTPARRGRAVAAFSMCIGLGAGLSFLVGSLMLWLVPGNTEVTVPLLGAVQGWQLAFIAAGSPGIPLALLMLTVREPPRREVVTANYRRASVGPLLRAHRRVAGLALLAVYIAGSLLNMMAYSIGAWSAAYFIRRFGLAPAEVGVMIGVTSIIAGAVGGLGGGWMSDWLAKRKLGGRIHLYPLCLVCMLPFVVIWPLAGSPWLALATLLACNLFTNAALMTTPTMIQELAPNEIRGLLIAGYTVSMGVVGAGLGPMSVALLTDHVFGDEKLVGLSLLTVALPCMAIVLAAALSGRQPYARARAAVIAATGSGTEELHDAT